MKNRIWPRSVVIAVACALAGCGSVQRVQFDSDSDQDQDQDVVDTGADTGADDPGAESEPEPDTGYEPDEFEPDLEPEPDAPDAPCTVYYRDADSDGYGDPTNSTCSTSPTPPAGYSVLQGDCDDDCNQAHVGQFEFFMTLCDSASASWDFDCDGAITYSIDHRDLVYPGNCEGAPGPTGCENRDGWEARAPSCGEYSRYFDCSQNSYGYCEPTITGQWIGCR